jgi:hypothetical protein
MEKTESAWGDMEQAGLICGLMGALEKVLPLYRLPLISEGSGNDG